MQSKSLYLTALVIGLAMVLKGLKKGGDYV